MAKHIYLESNNQTEIYCCEMNTLPGSYFENNANNCDKAIITAITLDLTNTHNNQNYWCAEIVEALSFPIIKYYHFKNLSDLVSTYYENGYKFIITISNPK
jgi:hypothetical protein